jgi:hypothetical protein
MNAAWSLARRLPREAALRILALPRSRFAPPDEPHPDDDIPARALDRDALTSRLARRYQADLPALLNACVHDELRELARTLRLPDDGAAPALRERLWLWGAEHEAGSRAHVGTALQPRPVVLGQRLIVQAPARGLWPPATAFPRPPPPAAQPAPPEHEPDSLDELLAAADRTIGVRLGARDADKGAWGVRVSELLGVVERGDDEPDWRGDVEVKTVPVTRTSSGLWRIAEDPAIAMVGATSPMAKLQRVLWLVRADTGDGDTAILSWYFLEWDAHVHRLVHRYLHQRPKGPANTQQRGWYLHKAFFADAGLLITLNGPP